MRGDWNVSGSCPAAVFGTGGTEVSASRESAGVQTNVHHQSVNSFHIGLCRLTFVLSVFSPVIWADLLVDYSQ